MRNFLFGIMTVALVGLAGCQQTGPSVQEYVQEVKASNDVMSAAVDEMRGVRTNFETQAQEGVFEWDQTIAEIDAISEKMDQETERFAALEAPEDATALKEYTVASYHSSTEVVRKQGQVVALMREMSELQSSEMEPEEMQAEGERLQGEFMAVQQEVAQLAEQSKEEAEKGREEQARLEAS